VVLGWAVQSRSERLKPTASVADFVRMGKEAEALGIAGDSEAIMAVAASQREDFIRGRSEQSLRRWRELVGMVAASHDGDSASGRWLGVECTRLGRAFEAAGLVDETLRADAERWLFLIASDERNELTSRFNLDLVAPLIATGTTEASRDPRLDACTYENPTA